MNLMNVSGANNPANTFTKYVTLDKLKFCMTSNCEYQSYNHDNRKKRSNRSHTATWFNDASTLYFSPSKNHLQWWNNAFTKPNQTSAVSPVYSVEFGKGKNVRRSSSTPNGRETAPVDIFVFEPSQGLPARDLFIFRFVKTGTISFDCGVFKSMRHKRHEWFWTASPRGFHEIFIMNGRFSRFSNEPTACKQLYASYLAQKGNEQGLRQNIGPMHQHSYPVTETI
ncbi:hypothetical protein OSB04_004532 [Centaurea solstitialis]|uniref:Uncharacterized protein n=1 Tax=Centaurea solstitialis TaxID=347529 RepID=A0AA38WVY4_9ASTR|nr:hypothetical protein OSB04_004532 [Centaurea solstitialis]